MTKLELIIKKNTQEEFLVDLGVLKAYIDIYQVNSPQVNKYKAYIEEKYKIDKSQIRGNWISYQHYLHKKII